MSITRIPYTNTALATARRCLTEFDLRYLQRLDRENESREALDVGTTWHKAFERMEQGALDAGVPSSECHALGYAAINAHAPSPLWAEKLRRLFAAYHWYWQSQPFEFVDVESSFEVELNGKTYRGQRDGRIRIDGQVGLLERKTTGSSISDGASWWDVLPMGVQVGLYALSCGERPAFILFDVVRKPTINPKGLTKKILERFAEEVKEQGFATYYGERVEPEAVELAAVRQGVDEAVDQGAVGRKLVGEARDELVQRLVG